MSFYYRTGLDDEGRSCVAERQEVSLERGGFVGHLVEGPIEIPGSLSSAALLVSPAPVGGVLHNFGVWRPGMYTDPHRTISVDFDVVLHGSVDLELEAETITLEQGDSVLIGGHVHAWRSGPDGALVAYTMVAGLATGADVDAPRGPMSGITHRPGRSPR
jgi:hypothetical protein